MVSVAVLFLVIWGQREQTGQQSVSRGLERSRRLRAGCAPLAERSPRLGKAVRDLRCVSRAFRSLVMRGMEGKKGIFTNVSLVNTVCKPDIFLFVCAEQQGSCVCFWGHLLTVL